MDVRERLAGAASPRVQEVARSSLGEPAAVLGAWEAVAVKGAVGALDGARSLFVLRGVARLGSSERPWSVVLKVLARSAGHDNPAHIDYWKREGLLYCSGLLDALRAGLSAPRWYGCDEPADGMVWLWLEHIQVDEARVWLPARWQRAARDLGR